jgi:choline-sulfatase
VARPFRYGFILGLVTLATALAAAGGWRYARASAPVNGPIILVTAESLRANRLTAYGYSDSRTPAIDALAADGIVFERAYSHAAQTLPAFASLLTGRLPFETGVRDDVGFTVKESERLLAEMLRDRGFATGAVMSTFTLRRDSGIAQGFNFFDDKMSSADTGSMISGVARDGAESERIAERWLDSAGTGRAFLLLQLNEPRGVRPPAVADAAERPYDRSTEEADDVIGRLTRYLKAHQLYDRSTIILSSAHGEGLGDHGEQTHGLFVYEEAVRVPLIIKLAAGEGAGRRVADIVQHVDLVPTVLDLAKAPIPGNVRGRSLKPLLDGASHLPERLAYSESLFGRYHFGWSELTTVTDGRYRYIKAPQDELYDLRQDPEERRNLALDPAQAQTLASLRAGLDGLVGASPIHPQNEVPADDRERFAALGSVGRAFDVEGAPADSPDPKDRIAQLEAYRSAMNLAVAREWPRAIERLLAIVQDDPSLLEVWRQLGDVTFRAGRYEHAIDAYSHLLSAQPADTAAHLAIIAPLVRLNRYDDARRQAEEAESVTKATDTVSKASVHEWLARIAIARHDADRAREEAALSAEADRTRPLPFYVDGRLLYDQGRYADALPLFEQAAAALAKSHGRAVSGLHFYLADTLTHVDRATDAEGELLAELKDFPDSVRARVALATLYHAAGRPEDAAQAVEDLVRTSPTAEAYTQAARLWTSLGDRRQASAARAAADRLTITAH